MSLNQTILPEFDHENGQHAHITGAHSDDKLSFKPHVKVNVDGELGDTYGDHQSLG